MNKVISKWKLVMFMILLVVVFYVSFTLAVSSEPSSDLEWKALGRTLNNTRYTPSAAPENMSLETVITFTAPFNVLYGLISDGQNLYTHTYSTSQYSKEGVIQLNLYNISQEVNNVTIAYQAGTSCVADDYVYAIGGYSGTVYQYNRDDLSLVGYSTHPSGTSASCIVSDDFVYHGDWQSGIIGQLNYTNISIENDFYSAYRHDNGMAIVGDRLYSAGLNSIIVINTSGMNSIQSVAPGTGYEDGDHAVIANGHFYAMYPDAGDDTLTFIFHRNATDITQSFSAGYTLAGAAYNAPAYANGYLYVGASDGVLYQLNASNITIQFSNFTSGGAMSGTGPAVNDEYVFINSNDGNFYQLNASDVSQEIARYNHGGTAYADPIIIDGAVYFGASSTIYQLGIPNTPKITLNSPADEYEFSASSESITFNCSATDNEQLVNISLYITGEDNNDFILNQTTNISGLSNESTWTLTLPEGNYTWNCLVQDNGSNFGWGTNQTLVHDITNPSLDFVSPTLSNGTFTTLTTLEINVTITERNLDKLIYDWNGTNYTLYNDSLVLMMNFDNISALGENETYVVDVSNNEFHGIVNGATWTNSSKYNGGFDFDGTSDYVNNSMINLSNDEITIAAWIKADSFQAVSPFISTLAGIEEGTAGNTQTALIRFGDASLAKEKMQFVLANTEGGQVKLDGTTTLQTNTWYYVAATYNGSDMQLYLDGVLETSDSGSISGGIQANGNFYVAYSNGGRYFDGLIDEVRIWNKSLSAKQVYQEYVSNLRKYDIDKWVLYVNQSFNATQILPDGSYSFQFYGEDWKSNKGFSELREMTVDTRDPEFTSIANQTIEYDTTTGFEINASDNIDVQCFDINDTTKFTINCTGYVENNTWLDIGLYGLNISVNDSAGNYNHSIMWVNISDTLEPGFSTITNQSIFDQDAFGYDIDASDDYNVSCFGLNDSTNFKINCSGYLENNTYLDVGLYGLNISVNDSSGNHNFTTMWVNVSYKPVIGLEVTTPSENVNVSQNELFTVTVNVSCTRADCSEIEVSLDPAVDYTDTSPYSSVSAALNCKESGSGTVDSCADGSSCTYPFQVDYMYIEDLNNTVFTGGDTVEVTLTAHTGCCSPDAVWAYSNETTGESNFRQVGRTVNIATGTVNYSKTFVLDDVEGNHTIRGVNIYSAASTSLLCGYDESSGATYSDTDDVIIYVEESGGTKSGLVSTTVGTTPFYTNTTNPYNLSLNNGSSATITWYVNATGSLDEIYEFFVYANQTSDLSVSNQSNKWNTTIVSGDDESPPTITLDLPAVNTNYTINVSSINYFASDNFDLSLCWYTTDLGVTNSSLEAANTNFSNIQSVEGWNNWTVYCNDSSNNIGNGSSSFFKDNIFPGFGVVSNQTNELGSSFSYDIDASDSNGIGCFYVNDTTVFAINCSGYLYNNTFLSFGLHELNISVNDSIGNINSTLMFVNVTDTTAPYFTDDVVVDQVVEYGNTFGYDVNASDLGNISCFTVNDTTNFVINCTGYLENVTTLGIDVYNLNITINDTTNNLNSTTMFVNVTDTTAPNFTNIENQTISVGASLSYDINASDLSGVSCFYVNDTTNFAINCTGHLSNSVSLSTGIYNLNITVNDTIGNMNYMYMWVEVETSVPIALNFTDPTPVNAKTQSETNVEINVSVVGEGIDNIVYNWNGTNYSMYNDSLMLMMNFDNISSFGENATYVVDVARGNNGTTINDVVINDSGKYGGGAHFDGVSDSINAGTDASLNITGPVTVSAWVYAYAYGPSDHSHIVGRTPSDLGAYANVNYYIGLKTRDPIFIIADTSTGVQCTDTTDLPLKTWTHIIGTWDGTTNAGGVKLYTNGILTDSQTSPITAIAGTSTNFYIGTSDNSFEFNGIIDEVRVWNRSLSAGEVYLQYVSNLQKFNNTLWNLYVNQSFNASLGLDDGNYTYQVFGFDGSGNSNQTEQRILTIDSSIPGFTDFENQTIEYGNDLGYDVDATDSNGVDCFTVNDTTNFAINCSGYLENSVILNVGLHWLNISVNDTIGNINSSILLVNVTPSLIVNCEAGGAYQQDALVLVQGNLSDGNSSLSGQVVNVSVYDSSGNRDGFANLTTADDGGYETTFSDLVAGSYTLNASASYSGKNKTCVDTFSIGSAASLVLDKIVTLYNMSNSSIYYNVSLKVINIGGGDASSGNLTDANYGSFDIGTISGNSSVVRGYLKEFVRNSTTYNISLAVASVNATDSYSGNELRVNSSEVEIVVPSAPVDQQVTLVKNVYYNSENSTHVNYTLTIDFVNSGGQDLVSITILDSDINLNTLIGLNRSGNYTYTDSITVEKAASNTNKLFVRSTATVNSVTYSSNQIRVRIPGYGGPADAIVDAPASVQASTDFDTVITVANQNTDIGQDFIVDYWISNNAETTNYTSGQQTIYVAASGETDLTATLNSPSSSGTYRFRALVTWVGGTATAFESFTVTAVASDDDEEENEGGYGGGGGGSGPVTVPEPEEVPEEKEIIPDVPTDEEDKTAETPSGLLPELGTGFVIKIDEIIPETKEEAEILIENIEEKIEKIEEKIQELNLEKQSYKSDQIKAKLGEIKKLVADGKIQESNELLSSLINELYLLESDVIVKEKEIEKPTSTYDYSTTKDPLIRIMIYMLCFVIIAVVLVKGLNLRGTIFGVSFGHEQQRIIQKREIITKPMVRQREIIFKEPIEAKKKFSLKKIKMFFGKFKKPYKKIQPKQLRKDLLEITRGQEIKALEAYGFKVVIKDKEQHKRRSNFITHTKNIIKDVTKEKEKYVKKSKKEIMKYKKGFSGILSGWFSGLKKKTEQVEKSIDKFRKTTIKEDVDRLKAYGFSVVGKDKKEQKLEDKREEIENQIEEKKRKRREEVEKRKRERIEKERRRRMEEEERKRGIIWQQRRRRDKEEDKKIEKEEKRRRKREEEEERKREKEEKEKQKREKEEERKREKEEKEKEKREKEEERKKEKEEKEKEKREKEEERKREKREEKERKKIAKHDKKIRKKEKSMKKRGTFKKYKILKKLKEVFNE